MGRIRYLGVVLYDADRIEAAAAVENEKDLYPAQLGLFLNPHDPAVQVEARVQGIPDQWIEAAMRSPVYKMAVEWKVALALHPEYRTLPMVWYVPPLSPIQSAHEAGRISARDGMPDVTVAAHPAALSGQPADGGRRGAGRRRAGADAGDAVLHAREKRRGRIDESIPERVGMTRAMVEEMYRIMALAAYEDRYVIPTAHRELQEDAYALRCAAGFGFREDSGGASRANLFGGAKHTPKKPYMDVPT